MKTKYITSSDGTRIAYDQTGRGPALMMLHGGGWTKSEWHKLGYVDRLKKDFTVISVDIRGNGESDKRVRADDYQIDRICEDLLTVASACDQNKFAIWGFSFGGNIARYLAARSNRISAIAVIGVPLFGPAVNETFDIFIDEYLEKWQPLVQAYTQGSFPDDASEKDKKAIASGNIAVWLGTLRAMRKWGSIDPQDVKCPILFAVGSENENAMNWMESNREILEKPEIQVEIFKGLNHNQEFDEIDSVFSVLSLFFNKQA
jgi:pimeloyl-ACP methyl ester carboxylesterase